MSQLSLHAFSLCGIGCLKEAIVLIGAVDETYCHEMKTFPVLTEGLLALFT